MRVVVVAVRREMVERVTAAARQAGLTVEGIDLSAFGMLRALPAPEPGRAVLYVNAAGLVNVAVANGAGCLFTRAAAGGLDAMAVTLAERRGLTLEHARQWMQHVGLVTPLEEVEGEPELVAAARAVLEEGVHEMADTVRNSLNFYRMQESAETVDRAVLTGPGVEVDGLADRLAELLRLPVETAAVAAAGEQRRPRPPHRRRRPGRGGAALAAPRHDRRLRRHAGARRRVLPERRRLPPAARRVAVAAPLALPRLRHAGAAAATTCRCSRGSRCAGAAAPADVPISPRYPLIEALTAALCVAVVLAGGGEPETLLGLAFVLLLVPIAFIDLDHRIIPNKLTGLGAVTALALVAALRPADLPEHLVAGVGAGGFLLAAALARPGGMGMGDVKLAGVMGLFLGVAVVPALLRRAPRRLARRRRPDGAQRRARRPAHGHPLRPLARPRRRWSGCSPATRSSAGTSRRSSPSASAAPGGHWGLDPTSSGRTGMPMNEA